MSENNIVNHIKSKALIGIQTTAIGALNDLENALGYLWAHGRKYEELNDEEKELRDIWEDVRYSILDRAENAKTIINNIVPEKRYITIIRKPNNKNGRRGDYDGQG